MARKNYFNRPPIEVAVHRKFMSEFSPDIVSLMNDNHTSRGRGLTIKCPYDLNKKFLDKLDACGSSTQLTAFVNEDGKLCHLVFPEFMLMIRLSFSSSLYELTVDGMFDEILRRVVRCVRL